MFDTLDIVITNHVENQIWSLALFVYYEPLPYQCNIFLSDMGLTKIAKDVST